MRVNHHINAAQGPRLHRSHRPRCTQLCRATPVEAEAIATALANGTYTPSPLDGPGIEAWAGFVAGVVPFAIGASEFGKRILIQQRCKTCSGSGLVPIIQSQSPLIDMSGLEADASVAGAGAGEGSRPRQRKLKKCLECGGFFPWVSWKMFLTSNASPGNGGPLLQPRGQKSVFYSVPPKEINVDLNSK